MKWLKLAGMALFVIVLLVAIGFGCMYFNGMSGITQKSGKPEAGQIRVACIGDSITYGHGISNWPVNNYPALLQQMLGEGYHVQNFGVSGRAVQDNSDQPYRGVQQYQDSLAYDADIIVFMMGSNDTKPENWFGEEAFRTALMDLLDDYTADGRTPQIYLCTVPACFYMEDSQEGLTSFDLRPAYADIIAEIVREVAGEFGCRVIDIHGLTEENPQWFAKDGVHPDNAGAAAVAEAVYEAITREGT